MAAIHDGTRDGADLVDFVLSVFRGQHRVPLKLRMEAATWLADRGFGKPVQARELSGAEGPPPAPTVVFVPWAPRVSEDDQREGCE